MKRAAKPTLFEVFQLPSLFFAIKFQRSGCLIFRVNSYNFLIVIKAIPPFFEPQYNLISVVGI